MAVSSTERKLSSFLAVLNVYTVAMILLCTLRFIEGMNVVPLIYCHKTLDTKRFVVIQENNKKIEC